MSQEVERNYKPKNIYFVFDIKRQNPDFILELGKESNNILFLEEYIDNPASKTQYYKDDYNKISITFIHESNIHKIL